MHHARHFEGYDTGALSMCRLNAIGVPGGYLSYNTIGNFVNKLQYFCYLGYG